MIARAALGILGGLLLVIGGIIALTQKGAADTAAVEDSYRAVFGLSETAPPLYAAMWAGVVVAAIGVLMLIGLLVAVAAQPRKAPAPAEASTGADWGED